MGMRVLRATVVAVLVAAGNVLPAAMLWVPSAADARSGSGGYSRPGIRTPSVGPSLGGGYRRPEAGRGFSGGLSGGDLGMAGRGAADALQRYRSQADRDRWGGTARTPGRERGAGTRTWTPPPYATTGPTRFGALDAMVLWFMLDALSQRPAATAFFQEHRDDPGFADWRKTAERKAADDPELRAKLDALDRSLVAGTPAQTSRPTGGFPWGVGLVLVLVLGGLWRARGRLVPRSHGPAAMTAPRSPFRIGQTIPLDPAPFILAGGAIKATPPEGVAGSGFVTVAALGTLAGGGTAWHRLYLPDGRRLLQVHLTAPGAPDECRLYERIDQVFPGSAEDWAFWLNDRDGLLGWSRFETKDGKGYDRVWGQGGDRAVPQALEERLTDLTGSRQARETAMLYAAATGLDPPAPVTEYLWVAAIEREGQTWIEVRAGIDVNPAALSLP